MKMIILLKAKETVKLHLVLFFLISQNDAQAV